MMKLARQMETAEQRRYWEQVDRAADEVKAWPAWLRGVPENGNGCGEERGQEDSRPTAQVSGEPARA
jgi:hypothetical protein